MAHTSGTQLTVGMGIESAAAPGVAVAESVFIPVSDFSVQAVSEKMFFSNARGLRSTATDSKIKRRYSQGSMTFVPTAKIAPYALSLALGPASSSAVADSAYTHTFSLNNTNATPRTATLTAKHGALETSQFKNVVCNSLNTEVSDEYAKMTLDMIGLFPGTDTVSENYSTETLMSYDNMIAKFGTSLANAGSASATPLKSFSLNLNNNIMLDEAFLSGSNEITAGNLIPGRFEATGSYSLHFKDMVELAKYKANTKNALIVTFEGALIGATSKETLRFKLGRIVLTKPPVEINIDGLMIINQEFTVEYEATDKEVTADVINNVPNVSGATYNPA